MSDDNDNQTDILFRQAMESLGVSRIDYPHNQGRPKNRGQTRHPGRNSIATHHKGPVNPVIVDQTDLAQSVLFARSGIPTARIKQLRRGRILIEESIDLHGLRQHEATTALEEFVDECLEDGIQSFLLIHGKGRRSEARFGILKPLATQWLKQQPNILAFCEALPQDGGSGALYVLLSPRT